MDSSAVTLLLLFSVNLVFLIVTVISFNVIRRVRGDRAKVKLTKEDMQRSGFEDLEAVLLDPTKRILHFFFIANRSRQSE